MQQAEDFRAESEALYKLLCATDEVRFSEPTLFKDWTINTVLQHLYMWNINAGLQISDEAQLVENMQGVFKHSGGMRGYEADYFDGLFGHALVSAWHEDMHNTADLFAESDPKARLKWAGPDMSARSSITARLMETWAHGQEVYDHLGVKRQNEDRIQNIVVLGVNTFGWTYQCRNETPPGDMPFLELTAPSGALWAYGEEQTDERVVGLAEEFCQVVTQCRNIADTSLKVSGKVATDWMSKAQCFAGGPETPPPPGTRTINISA